jgi:ArsR family transcriptional regulator
MKDLAGLLKALSDETRLQIISLLLLKEELCVCDIENVLELTQSKASRHLRYLLNAGVLNSRPKNTWVYYSIKNDLSPEKQQLINAVKANIDAEIRDSLNKKLKTWLDNKEDQLNCKN